MIAVAPAPRETYGLSWPGRADATAAAQAPALGRLVPEPEPGRHHLIVGDNLPVLGLLRARYGAVVKMIYIDPPYNTGRDFLFADNFRHARCGGAHGEWLSLMWPRLLVARELLRDDGALFVSIDDREVHHLRLLLDEIFGADNFIASIIWQKVFAPKNSARHFSADHEYVLVYARDANRWRPRLLPRTAAADGRYRNRDGDPRGPWASDNLCARNPYSAGIYPLTSPSGRVIPGPPPGTYWRVSRERFAALDADHRIWWGKDGSNKPRLKRFLSEVKRGRVPQTLWGYREVGHTQEAKKELLARLEFTPGTIFDTPKPTRLIRRMLRLATDLDSDDLILDFFAGSGTTGEAVLAQNAADGGRRRCVLVELDAPTPAEDYPTIAAITAARLRAAGTELGATHPGLDVDFGRIDWVDD